MTTKEQVQRESKSNGLRVFRTTDDQYYVESSEGKIAYRVSGSNGLKSCSCGSYTNEIEKDPSFQCKHILAVNGTHSGMSRLSRQRNRSWMKVSSRR